MLSRKGPRVEPLDLTAASSTFHCAIQFLVRWQGLASTTTRRVPADSWHQGWSARKLVVTGGVRCRQPELTWNAACHATPITAAITRAPVVVADPGKMEACKQDKLVFGQVPLVWRAPGAVQGGLDHQLDLLQRASVHIACGPLRESRWPMLPLTAGRDTKYSFAACDWHCQKRTAVTPVDHRLFGQLDGTQA